MTRDFRLDRWNLPNDPRGFDVCRTGVSGLLIAQALITYRYNRDVFGSEGILHETLFNNAFALKYLPSLQSIARTMQTFSLAEDLFFWCFFSLYLIGLILLAFGCWSRSAALLSLIFHATIMNSNRLVMYGFDHITQGILVYFVLLPAGPWSFDQRRASVKATSFSAWPLRLIQFHLFIIYGLSGFSKLTSTAWWTGSAIWRGLNLPPYGQNWPFPEQSSLFTILGLLVVSLELFYPIGMLHQGLRRVWLPAVLIFHAAIAYTMNLWLFGPLMMVLSWGCFGRFDRQTFALNQAT